MISEDERPQFQGVEVEVMEDRVACVQSSDRKLQLRGLSGLRHLVGTRKHYGAYFRVATCALIII